MMSVQELMALHIYLLARRSVSGALQAYFRLQGALLLGALPLCLGTVRMRKARPPAFFGRLSHVCLVWLGQVDGGVVRQDKGVENNGSVHIATRPN